MSIVEKTSALRLAIDNYGAQINTRANENQTSFAELKGPKHAIPIISQDNTPGAFQAGEIVRMNAWCTTPEEVVTAKGQAEGFASVFNTWKRISLGAGNPAQPAKPEELLTWQLDPGDVLRNNTNSTSMIGMISPEAYGDYVFEAVLKSTGNDDDMIGLAACYTEIDGVAHTLTIMRSVGGNALLIVGYDHYGPTIADRVYYKIGPFGLKWADGVVDDTRRSGGPEGGVNNYYGSWATCPLGVRLRITRQNDVITFETSDVRKVEGDSDAFVANATTVVDLNSDPRLAKFKGRSQIGYVCASQPFSTWETVQRPQSRRDIIDIPAGGRVWRWIDDAWVDVGLLQTAGIDDECLFYSWVQNKFFFRSGAALSDVT